MGVGPLAGIPKTPIILEFGQVARGNGALSKLPRAHWIGQEMTVEGCLMSATDRGVY